MPSRSLVLGVLALAVATGGTIDVINSAGPKAVAPTAAVQPAAVSAPGHRPAVQGNETRTTRHRPEAEATTPAATPPSPVVWTKARVAPVWIRPAKVRPVDRPALLPQPRIARWIDRQSIAQRIDLDRRVMTQALHGERVEVIRTDGAWTKVRLPLQRGSYYRRGIVGWVRSAHLARGANPPRPVVRRAHVRPSGAAAVQLASRYLGVRYLYGGMSHAGIDCSGLTYRVFAALGVTLPRDAADQSRRGTPVSRRHLRLGDLVFFGPSSRSSIHHVAIYVGAGRVIQAPHAGSRVRITPLSAWSDYWGARRIFR